MRCAAFDVSDRLLRQAARRAARPRPRLRVLRSRRPGTPRACGRWPNRTSIRATSSREPTWDRPPRYLRIMLPRRPASPPRNFRESDDRSTSRRRGVTIDARRSAAAKRAGAVSSFAGAMNESSMTAIAVLNHGVKATLDSLQLKMTARMMNAADTPDGQALLAHARELGAKGILAIEGILTASTTRPREGRLPRESAVAGSQGRAIQDLAIKLNHIVLAIDERNGERRSTTEGRGEDAASKPEPEEDRGTSKAETPKSQ